VLLFDTGTDSTDSFTGFRLVDGTLRWVATLLDGANAVYHGYANRPNFRSGGAFRNKTPQTPKWTVAIAIALGYRYVYLTYSSVWIVIYDPDTDTTGILQLDIKTGAVKTAFHPVADNHDLSYVHWTSNYYDWIRILDDTYLYLGEYGRVAKASLATGAAMAQNTGYDTPPTPTEIPGYCYWISIGAEQKGGLGVCGGFVIQTVTKRGELIDDTTQDNPDPTLRYARYAWVPHYRLFVFDRTTLELLVDLGESAEYGNLLETKPTNVQRGTPGSIIFISQIVRSKVLNASTAHEYVEWWENVLSYDGNVFTFKPKRLIQKQTNDTTDPTEIYRISHGLYRRTTAIAQLKYNHGVHG
jgi:hypothetical protein